MVKFVQFVVFLIIQIPMMPFAIIGTVVVVVRQFVLSRKLGVSSTAMEILNHRWIMHYFKSRNDEESVKLLKSIPTGSHYGMLCVMGAAIIANRICGYKPKFARLLAPEKTTFMGFVICRTPFFDRIMEKNIDQMDQVVFLGAGFDTRAFKYCKGKNVKVFELDQENTQNLKIKTLKKAGIEHEWITFVPIDFNQEAWIEKLIDHGFDASEKTFYHWEGVTLYLDEGTVKQTLKTVASSSGKGSVIAFDLYSLQFIRGEGSLMQKSIVKSMKLYEATFAFGIDTTSNAKENVETLLKETGLSLGKLSFMGETTEKKKPFGGLVEAVIK